MSILPSFIRLIRLHYPMITTFRLFIFWIARFHHAISVHSFQNCCRQTSWMNLSCLLFHLSSDMDGSNYMSSFHSISSFLSYRPSSSYYYRPFFMSEYDFCPGTSTLKYDDDARSNNRKCENFSWFFSFNHSRLVAGDARLLKISSMM